MHPVIQNILDIAQTMLKWLCSPDNAHMVILIFVTVVSIGLITTGWYSNRDKAEPVPTPDPYTVLYTQIGTWMLMLCILAVVFTILKLAEKPQ